MNSAPRESITHVLSESGPDLTRIPRAILAALMGYEILYCKACQSQVRGADLEKGLALKVDGNPYCPACARSLPREQPSAPPPPSGRRIPPRRGSTDRIPIPATPRAHARPRS